MGKAGFNIDEIRFITKDPEVTEAFVRLTATGDCPFFVDGWHHKTFPARIPTEQILKQYIAEAVVWPQEAPTN